MRTFARKFEFGLAKQTRLGTAAGKALGFGKDGKIRIFDTRTGAVSLLRERKIDAYGVALSPAGGFAALVEEHHGLHLVDLVADTDVARLEGGFRAATFMDESTLWAVTSPDESSCEWQIYDVRTGVKLHSHRMQDPVGASAILLRKHPIFRGMVLLLGGGQDGQMAHWVEEGPRGRVASVLFDVQHDLGTPAFHRNGREMLLIVDGGFARYSFPDRKVLSHAAWPEDCENPVYYMEYASRGQAVALADNGRLLLFDRETGEHLDDCQIEGHEAREAEAGDDDAVSDVNQFRRLDDSLALTVHYGDRRSPEPERLVLWQLDSDP